MSNLLHLETSPYLLQHKDNPVHWRPWGPEALAEAKARSVPILLSVGYAACHWCHVMAHESFEDAATAALMNQHFVNVKVDREERPDIDSIYQAALALTGEQGGWPLTMFLDGEGHPFYGGTYFPPTSRYGRPGFRDLLREIARLYADEPAKVEDARERLAKGLARFNHVAEADPRAGLTMARLDAVARTAVRETDPFSGGLGSAPKFPQPFIYHLIWRAFLRNGQAPFKDAVTTTLTHMAQGGIYDHLGGGFARYAVDDAWLVPHFEKMLYDNGQLIELYALIAAKTGSALYRRRVEETITFLNREMTTTGGAFAASLDADSEGEEGKFYVWSAREIDVVLTQGTERFKQIYGVEPLGNWEGHNILNRLGALDDLDPQIEAELTAQRLILFNARAKRVRPGYDDKVLTDWNGLTITGIARAGAWLGRPDWIARAAQAFAAITTMMSDGDRLYHAARLGQVGAKGLAEDHANMARAALALHQATGEPDYLKRALAWIAAMEAHFFEPERGTYAMTAKDAEALILRPRSTFDNAVPAANGTMVEVLALAYHLTGEDAYRRRAESVITALTGDLNRGALGLSSLLNGFELLAEPISVVVIGVDEAARRPLVEMALRAGEPNLVLHRLRPAETLPRLHPAFGKTMIADQPTAYVCRGTTCSLPVHQPADLANLLTRPKGGTP